jgi:hypothetical protein
MVVGYHGQKVGLFLLNDNNVMRDTGRPDGRTANQLALIEQAHSQSKKIAGSANIKSVGLPINQIVNYDLANYKLSLCSDFNLSEFMEEAL